MHQEQGLLICPGPGIHNPATKSTLVLAQEWMQVSPMTILWKHKNVDQDEPCGDPSSGQLNFTGTIATCPLPSKLV